MSGGLPPAFDSAAAWAVNYRRLRGVDYSFFDYKNPHRHRPFLLLPIMVQPRNKGYKKSRQAGVSENSVTEALWALDTYPVNIVYTFPSPKQVEDFSNTRVRAALEESESLSRMQGRIQNVTLKQLGLGYLFLRSSTNEKLGEGIDADIVVFDEIDRMRRNVGIAFKESLSASKFGWVRELSTPTLPNKGIDELWKKSNQCHWYVKCEACGHEQVLRFPDNILELKSIQPYEKIVPHGTYEFCCSKCRQVRLNRWDGRWVPSYPMREDHVCFHINQLMCVWISADEIMQKKRDYKFPQLFWNYVLGDTYAADNILLNETHLERCIDVTLREITWRDSKVVKVSVGIDWGNFNWVTVIGLLDDGRKTLLALFVSEDRGEPLDSTKAIEKFIRPFRPERIVADWGYGKDRVTYLLRQFPGRVYGCSYLDNSKIILPRFSDATSTVNVDRTAWLKTMTHTFREQGISIPSGDAIPQLPTFIKHMTSLVTMMDEDDEGNITERIDNIGEDHFAHATGYALMGLEAMEGTGVFSYDFL